MIAIRDRLKPLRSDDRGYTITELMVVVLILGLLMVAFYSFLFGGERAATDGREWLEMNQTARLAFERLTRELREADQILAVSPSDGSTQIQFRADFDASGSFVDGVYIPTFTNDEVITYEFDSASRQLNVENADGDAAILANNISSLRFRYYGSDPRMDCATGDPPSFGATCSAPDGIVTWQEIDQASSFGRQSPGNNNNILDVEFPAVSSIVIEMTVSVGGRNHNYRTAVELRNSFS